MSSTRVIVTGSALPGAITVTGQPSTTPNVPSSRWGTSMRPAARPTASSSRRLPAPASSWITATGSSTLSGIP
eukprot:2505137-Pyramimonas_sp.AAC.1